MPRNVLIGLIAAVAAALGLAFGTLLLKPNAIAIASGTMLPTPRAIPEFALTGDNGRPYTHADLVGHWTLIFVGFTNCPDVCPTTLTTLKAVRQKLGPQDDQVKVLLLSIDPERDTPERLATYVHFFDPSFVGATGANAELDKLASAMSFVYVKVPGATPDSYTMDHSSALMLVNPKGELAGFFTAPQKADLIAADLKTILGNERS